MVVTVMISDASSLLISRWKRWYVLTVRRGVKVWSNFVVLLITMVTSGGRIFVLVDLVLSVAAKYVFIFLRMSITSFVVAFKILRKLLLPSCNYFV